MRKLIYHIVRLFRNFWFVLLLAFAISPVIGLGVLIIATAISLVFFSNPKDTKDPKDYFTEEELRKIQSEEDVDDEEYLTLLAKYQSYECPIKVDQITTWTSSEVTKESFICNYEINDRWHRYGDIDFKVVKNNILSELDKEGYKVQRILATNRNLIYRYWNRQTNTVEDIVLSEKDLRS